MLSNDIVKYEILPFFNKPSYRSICNNTIEYTINPHTGIAHGYIEINKNGIIISDNVYNGVIGKNNMPNFNKMLDLKYEITEKDENCQRLKKIQYDREGKHGVVIVIFIGCGISQYKEYIYGDLCLKISIDDNGFVKKYTIYDDHQNGKIVHRFNNGYLIP
jgi:hypothetical protein